MRAKEWIEQAEKMNNGKRQFARQRLIDALEQMTDEQVNTLCGDIVHMDSAICANGAPPSEHAPAMTNGRFTSPDQN